MAAGDVTFFDLFTLAAGNAVHDFDTDVIKFGVINGTDPVVTQTTPTWGDFSAQQVGEFVGGYVTGGNTLVVTQAHSAGTTTVQAESFTYTQNAGGFPDGGWGIIYNSSKTDQCICFMELSATDAIDQTAGDVVVKFNNAASGVAGDWFTITTTAGT